MGIPADGRAMTTPKAQKILTALDERPAWLNGPDSEPVTGRVSHPTLVEDGHGAKARADGALQNAGWVLR